ncbi:MAG TPA: DUF1554 domain-containing protein [Polyangiaceae bacterium]|nr:DUF1554 domain-containing protein [Polyangiaceae bacterium]
MNTVAASSALTHFFGPKNNWHLLMVTGIANLLIGCLRETTCADTLTCPTDSGARLDGGLNSRTELDSAARQGQTNAANRSSDAGSTSTTRAPLSTRVDDAGASISEDSGAAVNLEHDAGSGASLKPDASSAIETETSDASAASPDAGTDVSSWGVSHDAAMDGDANATVPVCGNGMLEQGEVCDDGAQAGDDLGDCNPACSGYYEKKYLRLSTGIVAGNFGGPEAADAACELEFGTGWKALIVGGGRRATSSPYLGDDAEDWVLHPYVHYYNWRDELVWRTDETPLLGARDGKQMNVYAPAFDDTTGHYPWTGFAPDWTTVPDSEADQQGTCNGWTSETGFGMFAKADLSQVFNDYCGSKWSLLCVEQ